MSIRELARHLNISIGTVSRALNGRADVNAETRERVLKAAAELGYAPNQSGRSLRQGTTNAVGFMIETNRETSLHGDTFFMSVYDGVQSVFAQHHLDLIILPCPFDDDPCDYVRRVVSRRFVDGLFISATQRHDERIDYLIEREIPFVALGRSLSGGPHSWIDLDFEGVAAESVRRLVARGHRRIGLINTGNDINLGYVFADGYRRAMAEAGIPYRPEFVIRADQTSEEGGYGATDRLLALAERPTAMLLVNEIMAIGAYRRLHDAGLMPGRDMAVIGFRRSPQARFLSPTLTCFEVSLFDMGRRLAEAMLGLMPAYRDLYPGPVVQEIWPMHLVGGESDPPPLSLVMGKAG
ncbi:substrate-binding domain-containing protein [Kaistia dalseonensis]|uniref:DNA-binding LacI/PurR family transcriptional regulator n=1 Tax=Kaistia dalseonensis TaxID=410840 RepID=A0ABU0H5J6_9HYPH|nr:substrate-binding domain-containing protein [Kaistia dalseonensis]MCX5494984.1 substrate-binding domain-containing protein [Kaistia dalseonensis]MDQ0437565.1 DNA-binding LacI/PurR family transcriptional regulator [Kaistia dalseonensis]